MSEWQTIETIPTDESKSFLVLWENDMNAWIVLQVSWFEGNLYPDHMGGMIDHDDVVEGYSHWMNCPNPPEST